MDVSSGMAGHDQDPLVRSYMGAQRPNNTVRPKWMQGDLDVQSRFMTPRTGGCASCCARCATGRGSPSATLPPRWTSTAHLCGSRRAESGGSMRSSSSGGAWRAEWTRRRSLDMCENSCPRRSGGCERRAEGRRQNRPPAAVLGRFGSRYLRSLRWHLNSAGAMRPFSNGLSRSFRVISGFKGTFGIHFVLTRPIWYVY